MVTMFMGTMPPERSLSISSMAFSVREVFMPCCSTLARFCVSMSSTSMVSS